jgi:putative ABC transport system permease protein
VTGTGAAASLALALLVMVCVFVAVAAPRASLGYRTEVLQRLFHAGSSTQTTVLADGDLNGLDQGYLTAAQLAAASGQLAAGLRRGGVPLAPPAAQWSGLVTGSSQIPGNDAPAVHGMLPPALEILYRSGLDNNATLAAGSWPARVRAHGPAGAFEAAVTAATAARLGLHVGSRLRTAGQVLVVTGIIRPRGAASSFWTVDPVASEPRLTYRSVDSPPYLSTAAFVGGAELPALERRLNWQGLRLLWSFPLSLGHVNADRAAGLQQALQGMAYLPAANVVSTHLSRASGAAALLVVNLSSGLLTALPPFVATDDAVQRVLSLLFVSLAVVAAVVVLLGARLVAEHRRGEFALMRARGASAGQVATVALRGGAVAVVPAAVAAAAAAAAVPGPASWLSWWLAGVIVAAALAGPPVLAVWATRTRRGAARAALAAGTRRKITPARRWVGDGALACAAVGGLVILRRQGLPPPGSVDLFTSLAPVLVAIPVALVIIRAYPPVLRRLARLAGRRRGVVMVVGLARGSAAARAGGLPAFALILAFAVVAFATMARGAVARAGVAASWQASAADAVITAPATGPGMTPAVQRLITGVPGTRRAATVAVTTGTSGEGLPLRVVVIDPRRYAALVAATPAPPFPAAALARSAAAGAAPTGPVPALISPAARTMLGPGSTLWVAGHELRLRVTGTLASIVGGPAGSQFAVLPRWALPGHAPQPTSIALVGPQLDTATLARVARHAVPGAQITLRSRLLAGISQAPLPHGGFVTFAQGALAAGAFSLLILLLMLVLSARSREMTLARLATMGLGSAQSRRVTAMEILPAILAAAAGGTVCALALVPLVGPAVDLAAFTGTSVAVPLYADPLALGIAVGGLLLLAGVTLAVQDRLARRRGVSQALRVGE